MKHVAIIVPEGDCSLTNIEGTHHILTEVNDYFISNGKEPAFKVQLVGLQKQTRMKKGLFSIHPEVLIDEVTHTDLIIVPALQGDIRKALEMNENYLPWLVKHYKQGAALASLCVGSFLLAATGLLNGRKCATHWIAANDFRTMFPDVILVPDKIITDEQDIYSSGGAYSSLNLILYLVEKYAGREVAVYCSKIFQIDFQRDSQSPFTIFKGQKEHQDELIKKTQEFIELNFQDKITVDHLSEKFAIGRRSLERRFKRATSNTVSEYIQRVKIEAAKKSMESSRKNINEVMSDVGYVDNKAFRETFKKITGILPLEYKNKYNYTKELLAQ